jgi:hypothetical protein
MTEEQLIELYKSKGYGCVYTFGCYHAIAIASIEGEQVKEGACSSCMVSQDLLKDIPVEEIKMMMDWLQVEKSTGIPFDITQPYVSILPKKERDVPEWHRWPVEYVRKVPGIDKNHEQ